MTQRESTVPAAARAPAIGHSGSKARGAARVWPAVLVAAIAGVGVCGLLVATRWGIGTSPDSVQYIRAARRMLGEHGGALADGQHAPLYSLLLAAGGWLGLDPLDGARWLNAVVFGLNILVVGLMVWRAAPGAPAFACAAALVVAGSEPVVTTHATALSEPIFVLLLLAGFWWLGQYLDGNGRRELVASALALGFALLARYAGAAALLAGGVAIAGMMRPSLSRRLGDLLIFATVGSAPMLAWLARSAVADGSVANRAMAFHPIELAQVREGLHTVSRWFLVPHTASDAIRVLVCIGVGSAVVLTLVRLRRSEVLLPTLTRVLTLFFCVYLAFLVVSISLFDANTPLDDRILLPAFIAAVVGFAQLAATAWKTAKLGMGARAVAAGGVIFVIMQISGGYVVVSHAQAAGIGFSSRVWRGSPTIAAVAALPKTAVLYSNAPRIVYLHTRRAARAVPKRRYLMTRQANSAFEAELATLERDLKARCGVIVYFRGLQGQKSMATEAELRSRPSLRVLTETNDGVLLGPGTCGP